MQTCPGTYFVSIGSSYNLIDVHFDYDVLWNRFPTFKRSARIAIPAVLACVEKLNPNFASGWELLSIHDSVSTQLFHSKSPLFHPGNPAKLQHNGSRRPFGGNTSTHPFDIQYPFSNVPVPWSRSWSSFVRTLTVLHCYNGSNQCQPTHMDGSNTTSEST